MALFPKMKDAHFRRLLFLFLLGAVFTACNSKNVSRVQSTRLVVFIDSFDKANSRYYNTESGEKYGDSLLKASFVAGCRIGNLLVDFPFTLHDIGRSLEGQYYAHLTEATSVRPDWSIGLDLIVPVSDKESRILVKNGVYKVKNIGLFEPVTKAWIYNVDLYRTVLPYLIRENERSKVIDLGTNYVEATIFKD